MNDPTVNAAVPRVPAGTADLGASMRRLAAATVGYAEAKAGSGVGQAKGVAEPAGVGDRAVVEGLKAGVTGGNPVSAALRGAWAAADAKTKIAIVAILLLVAVLSPVLLLLLLLGLLVTALVLKARGVTA